VPLRICAVSFADVRGVRHTVEVQAESLFEAAILGVRTFKGDPWIEHVGPATVLDIEVREPAAKHAITMMHVERWLEGASTSPNEEVKKAKLKDLLGSPSPLARIGPLLLSTDDPPYEQDLSAWSEIGIATRGETRSFGLFVFCRKGRGLWTLVQNRVLCGFASRCGRVLCVHRGVSVHGLRWVTWR